MSKSKLVNGTLSRTLKTTAMATKSGMKHLGYLGAKNFSTNPEQLKKDHEQDIGKILFSGLSQMRGTALKASQLLSLEVDLLPEGIRKELSKSCYNVPPINKALVRKVFIQEFKQDPASLFAHFTTSSFAAASLGQVHRATIAGEDVAVKVQYPGIRESIDSDLQILSVILTGISKTTNYLPQRHVIQSTLDEIEICLKDEIDYRIEAKNTLWFKENLKVENIRLPKVYPDYSSTRILTTELLSGLHINEWLATNPSQQERDVAGQTVFDAFLHCIFSIRALHADPHDGNYLFLDNGEVGLLDFGCVKFLDEDFSSEIAGLIHGGLNQDQTSIFSSYKRLNLFSQDLTFEEYTRHVLPALSDIQKWMCAPFMADSFDFKTLPPPPMSNPDHHENAIRYLHGLKRDQIYFDRTYFGVYQLLRKIGAVVTTQNPWIK